MGTAVIDRNTFDDRCLWPQTADMNIIDFYLIHQIGGVSDISAMLGVGEEDVRDWARENDVPRIGNAFVFYAGEGSRTQ